MKSRSKSKVKVTRSKVLGTTYRHDFGDETEVEVRSMISRVQILDGRTLLWQASAAVHAPRGLLIEKGETVEQAVRDRMKYNIGFFSKVQIPKQVVNPDYTWGLGETPLE